MKKGSKLTHKRKSPPPFTEEHRRKMSSAIKGKRIGQKNPMWKEDAKYRTIHIWVCHWKGQSDVCEKCGKNGLVSQQIQWANKDHKYSRILDDYIRLCAKCHYNYDKEHGLRD